MNSNWLITSELANQHVRKVLFTCVVLVIVVVVVIVMLLLLILFYMLILFFNSLFPLGYDMEE